MTEIRTTLIPFHLSYFVISSMICNYLIDIFIKNVKKVVKSYSLQWERFPKARNKIDHVVNNLLYFTIFLDMYSK